MAVSERLRQAIQACGQTHYRITQECGVATAVIDRFVSGKRPNITASTIDRLCDYFSLELRPKKRRKQARKSAETATKRRRKKTQ